MAGEGEGASVVEEDRLEDPVTDDESVVEHRDGRVLLGDERAIDIDEWHAATLRSPAVWRKTSGRDAATRDTAGAGPRSAHPEGNRAVSAGSVRRRCHPPSVPGDLVARRRSGPAGLPGEAISPATVASSNRTIAMSSWCVMPMQRASVSTRRTRSVPEATSSPITWGSRSSRCSGPGSNDASAASRCPRIRWWKPHRFIETRTEPGTMPRRRFGVGLVGGDRHGDELAVRRAASPCARRSGRAARPRPNSRSAFHPASVSTVRTSW